MYFFRYTRKHSIFWSVNSYQSTNFENKYTVISHNILYLRLGFCYYKLDLWLWEQKLLLILLIVLEVHVSADRIIHTVKLNKLLFIHYLLEILLFKNISRHTYVFQYINNKWNKTLNVCWKKNRTYSNAFY